MRRLLRAPVVLVLVLLGVVGALAGGIMWLTSLSPRGAWTAAWQGLSPPPLDLEVVVRKTKAGDWRATCAVYCTSGVVIVESKVQSDGYSITLPDRPGGGGATISLPRDPIRYLVLQENHKRIPKSSTQPRVCCDFDNEANELTHIVNLGTHESLVPGSTVEVSVLVNVFDVRSRTKKAIWLSRTVVMGEDGRSVP